MIWEREAYSKLPATPEPLNDAQVVQYSRREEHFCAVGVA